MSLQNLGSFLGVIRRIGIHLIIEIVEQPDDAPLGLVFSELHSISPHAGFNRKHMLDQAVALGMLLQQLKG